MISYFSLTLRYTTSTRSTIKHYSTRAIKTPATTADPITPATFGPKVVDQAKGLIMKSRGVDEDTAYKLLRKAAMNGNRRIADVAESLVMSARLLGDEGK